MHRSKYGYRGGSSARSMVESTSRCKAQIGKADPGSGKVVDPVAEPHVRTGSAALPAVSVRD